MSYSIGDVVQVVNPGRTYSTFHVAFTSMGFKDKGFNAEWNEGEEGVIFNIAEHPSQTGKVLIALRSTTSDKECLISTDGIALVSKSSASVSVVDKEFVMEAYKAACGDWQIKIRKQFPQWFDPYFKFPEDARLGTSTDLPVFVSLGIRPQGMQAYQALVVYNRYDLEVRKENGYTFLLFKEK